MMPASQPSNGPNSVRSVSVTVGALRQSMGDTHAAEAVADFIALATERIDEARTLAEQLDPGALGHLLRPIRSAADELGAEQLAWVCARMANLADSGDTPTALALLPMLESRYREARVAMAAALDD
jgi:HPt (histidine-containing phosphotransfer) domain-containing protein